jgi:hypothetical protein
MTLNDIINDMYFYIGLGERERAEEEFKKARHFINNGGEMDGQQYDRLRQGQKEIARLLVEQTPEMQPTELIPMRD